MRLLQEYKHSQTSLYIYEDESYKPLARVDGSGPQQKVRHYHNDLNGTPEQLTETDGHTIWQASYRVWGDALEEVREPSYIEDQNLRFQGQYLDREIGLHYNTLRFYDPDVGRFTTRDPIGLKGGINLYKYAPNPMSWVDPLGLSRCAPGTASGKGVTITNKWLRGSHGNAGLFPASIANKMRGKTFNTFNDFRNSFWKEVAMDKNLSKKFSPSNLKRMQNGNAPIAHGSQWNGKNRSYILHHREPIQHGGGVYDMDNLMIVTPKFHLDVLDRDYHF